MVEVLGDLQSIIDEVIIGGDFNAKSYAWHSTSTDAWGSRVEGCIARNDLCIANLASQPKSVHTMNRSNNIGITFTIPTFAVRLTGWRAVADLMSSDYRAIFFDIQMRIPDL